MACGVLLNSVRSNSRRTQPSSAHNDRGWAGAEGPMARNGDSSATATVATSRRAIPGMTSSPAIRLGRSGSMTFGRVASKGETCCAALVFMVMMVFGGLSALLFVSLLSALSTAEWVSIAALPGTAPLPLISGPSVLGVGSSCAAGGLPPVSAPGSEPVVGTGAADSSGVSGGVVVGSVLMSSVSYSESPPVSVSASWASRSDSATVWPASDPKTSSGSSSAEPRPMPAEGSSSRPSLPSSSPRSWSSSEALSLPGRPLLVVPPEVRPVSEGSSSDRSAARAVSSACAAGIP